MHLTNKTIYKLLIQAKQSLRSQNNEQMLQKSKQCSIPTYLSITQEGRKGGKETVKVFLIRAKMFQKSTAEQRNITARNNVHSVKSLQSEFRLDAFLCLCLYDKKPEVTFIPFGFSISLKGRVVPGELSQPPSSLWNTNNRASRETQVVANVSLFCHLPQGCPHWQKAV